MHFFLLDDVSPSSLDCRHESFELRCGLAPQIHLQGADRQRPAWSCSHRGNDQKAGFASHRCGEYNVRHFGATATGTHLDTKGIQAAVDACGAAGGGTVRFPAGKYLSGTIFLKSNVCLLIERGATLLGSTSLADYPSVRPRSVRTYTDYYVRNSLIYAEDIEHVAITGGGTIDGQGGVFQEKYPKRPTSCGS